jgi:hypothetical protein
LIISGVNVLRLQNSILHSVFQRIAATQGSNVVRLLKLIEYLRPSNFFAISGVSVFIHKLKPHSKFNSASNASCERVSTPDK